MPDKRKTKHTWERGPNLPVPEGYTVVRLGKRHYPMKIEKTPLFGEGEGELDLPLVQQALAREREQAEAANDTARVQRLTDMQRLLAHLEKFRPDLFSSEDVTLHTLRDEENAVAQYSARVYAVQFLERYAPPTPSPDTTSER